MPENNSNTYMPPEMFLTMLRQMAYWPEHHDRAEELFEEYSKAISGVDWWKFCLDEVTDKLNDTIQQKIELRKELEEAKARIKELERKAATVAVDGWPTEDDYDTEYEEFKEGDSCTGRIDDAFRAGWCAYEERTAPMRSARRLLSGGE